LREVPASELGSKKTALLNLIDFSPLPTEEQKACGIDTHLLQTDAVTKRVKDEYDNSTPDNLINKNSRVNTRYTDQKPGHLSEKIMTGLAETFIRTSVIHNIFKGLFLLTKQRFNLTEFGMLEILYIFLESRVRMDVERQGLTEDFEKEYEKIFDIYKKQEKPLIPEDDNGSNKLRSIVRYHIDSVTEHLSKMLNIKEDTEIKQFSALLRRRSKDMFRIPPTAINKDPISKKRRDNFFKNIDKPGPYMNFWKKNPEVYDILIPTKHHDGSQKTTTLHGSYTIVAYTPDKLLKSNLWYDNVLSNMSLTYDINDPDINSWKRMPKLILEKYVRIQKSDYMTQKFVQLLSNNQDFNNLVHKYISRSDFDGVITLENYSILVADFNTAKAKSSTLSNVYLYKNESELQENEISFLAMPPKFGMRLSLLKEEKSFRLYDPNQEENILNENGGFIYNYSFMGGTLQDSTKITNNKAFISFKEKFTNNIDPQYLFNKKEKIGYIQPYYDSGWQQRYQRESIYELYRNGAKEDRPRFEGQSRDLTEREDNAAVEAQNQYLKDHPNSSWLDRSASVINIIPLIQYEEETPEELFRPPASVADFEREKGIFKLAVEEMYEDTSLEDKIKNDYKFDLLVNYCLPYGMQNTFALLNCMVGMVDEKIMKLLDGTKTIIKDSYKNQKSAGRFRSNPKSGKYEKSKKAEQDGPFPAAFAKAALTIPISTLKGMATSVDPNIFYADKIVLAGKMGFVQPKYRRLSVGEKYRIEGTNQFLEISEEGIASKSDFKYDDGELVVRNPATQDTGYEIEYTYVAKVENKKIVKRRDSEGKMVYVVKQGLGYSGVPVKREGNEFTLVNSQVDEKEVETFDMQPSVPIFPGEKIDIPYAIASLLLAPLPIFPPGASLTAYNLAMPFGPIFLALEPLLFETQQFKTAKTKKKNTPEDTSGNLSCKTPEQLSQTGSAGDANSKPPLNLMELLTRSNDEALDSVFNTITTQIIPHINITFSVASKTDFIKNKLFKSLKENGIEFTEQILSQITEFIKTNHSITKERLRKFLNK
jgi:hypothetical protein